MMADNIRTGMREQRVPSERAVYNPSMVPVQQRLVILSPYKSCSPDRSAIRVWQRVCRATISALAYEFD